MLRITGDEWRRMNEVDTETCADSIQKRNIDSIQKSKLTQINNLKFIIIIPTIIKGGSIMKKSLYCQNPKLYSEIQNVIIDQQLINKKNHQILDHLGLGYGIDFIKTFKIDIQNLIKNKKRRSPQTSHFQLKLRCNCEQEYKSIKALKKHQLQCKTNPLTYNEQPSKLKMVDQGQNVAAKIQINASLQTFENPYSPKDTYSNPKQSSNGPQITEKPFSTRTHAAQSDLTAATILQSQLQSESSLKQHGNYRSHHKKQINFQNINYTVKMYSFRCQYAHLYRHQKNMAVESHIRQVLIQKNSGVRLNPTQQALIMIGNKAKYILNDPFSFKLKDLTKEHRCLGFFKRTRQWRQNCLVQCNKLCLFTKDAYKLYTTLLDKARELTKINRSYQRHVLFNTSKASSQITPQRKRAMLLVELALKQVLQNKPKISPPITTLEQEEENWSSECDNLDEELKKFDTSATIQQNEYHIRKALNACYQRAAQKWNGWIKQRSVNDEFQQEPVYREVMLQNCDSSLKEILKLVVLQVKEMRYKISALRKQVVKENNAQYMQLIAQNLQLLRVDWLKMLKYQRNYTMCSLISKLFPDGENFSVHLNEIFSASELSSLSQKDLVCKARIGDSYKENKGRRLQFHLNHLKETLQHIGKQVDTITKTWNILLIFSETSEQSQKTQEQIKASEIQLKNTQQELIRIQQHRDLCKLNLDQLSKVSLKHLYRIEHKANLTTPRSNPNMRLRMQQQSLQQCFDMITSISKARLVFRCKLRDVPSHAHCEELETMVVNERNLQNPSIAKVLNAGKHFVDQRLDVEGFVIQEQEVSKVLFNCSDVVKKRPIHERAHLKPKHEQQEYQELSDDDKASNDEDSGETHKVNHTIDPFSEIRNLVNQLCKL